MVSQTPSKSLPAITRYTSLANFQLAHRHHQHSAQLKYLNLVSDAFSVFLVTVTMSFGKCLVGTWKKMSPNLPDKKTPHTRASAPPSGKWERDISAPAGCIEELFLFFVNANFKILPQEGARKMDQVYPRKMWECYRITMRADRRHFSPVSQ